MKEVLKIQMHDVPHVIGVGILKNTVDSTEAKMVAEVNGVEVTMPGKGPFAGKTITFLIPYAQCKVVQYPNT